MATVPVEITWVAGTILLASQLNTNVRDAVNFLIAPPLASLRQTNAQTFATNTWTAVTWNVEDIDRDGGHSTVTNPSRYVAKTAGYYLVSGAVTWTFANTGSRLATWRVGGSDIPGTGGGFSASGTLLEITVSPRTRQVYMNVSDYIEMWGYHDRGSSLNTSVGSDAGQSTMHVQWVSS